jgi:hypothetical protein
MGTAHGAEELGLCTHGLACQAGAWGRYIGFCLGYGHIPILKISGFFDRLSITLAHDEILTNGFLRRKRGTKARRARAGLSLFLFVLYFYSYYTGRSSMY